MAGETRIANWRRIDQSRDDVVYVGRPRGKKAVWACQPGEHGYFGNPHVVGFCPVCNKIHRRGETLNHYKHYFMLRLKEDDVFKAEVLKLQGKTLACFCVPKPCHAGIMASWIDSQVGDVDHDAETEDTDGFQIVEY